MTKLLKRVKPIEGEEIMDVTELAHFLKIAPRSVYNLVKDGKIPVLKVGSKFRFSRQGVIQAMSKLDKGRQDK